MGKIVKNNKEIDIDVLIKEQEELQNTKKIKDIFNNEIRKKIKADILNETYTDLQLEEDYNISYSLGKLYIELILENESYATKILNYTHNLPIFLTIFSIATAFSKWNINQKLISQKNWRDWAKKYNQYIN